MQNESKACRISAKNQNGANGEKSMENSFFHYMAWNYCKLDWEVAMKHFKFGEFACRCCGVNRCPKEFMEKIDIARDLSGVPWVLNSAYRCKENNEKVGGQKDSAHMEGLAVDVRATDPFTRFRIIAGAIQAGFTRIKVYSRWVHIDETKNESKPKVWFGIGVHE